MSFIIALLLVLLGCALYRLHTMRSQLSANKARLLEMSGLWQQERLRHRNAKFKVMQKEFCIKFLVQRVKAEHGHTGYQA